MANLFSDRAQGEPEMPPNQRLRLNVEELRILQECNRESFYYRCVPFATTAMVTTYLAVKRGFLQPNAKYGATIKVIGACFVGWFIGKLSYRSKCEEKFLNLQNSTLADAIRKKRGYNSEGFDNKTYRSTDDITLRPEDTQSFTLDDDFGASSQFSNFDTNKSTPYADVEDRQTSDSLSDLPVEEKPSRSTTTYDDLRKKNREEYEQRQLKFYQPSQPTSRLSPTSPRELNISETKPQSRQSSYGSGNAGVKNIYGDTWEK